MSHKLTPYRLQAIIKGMQKHEENKRCRAEKQAGIAPAAAEGRKRKGKGGRTRARIDEDWLDWEDEEG